VLVRDGKIVAAGVRAEVERRAEAKAAEKLDVAGGWFAGICGFAHTPDSCGEPAEEYELKIQGASYEEIARKGGGY